MARFFIPEKFFRVQKRDTLLAFFSFVDNETGLEYTNWRLLQGTKGPFVGAPSETYDHPTKGKQYYPYVRPAYDSTREDKRNPKGDAFMQELTEAVWAVYDKKSAGATASAGATSGRGPVSDPTDDGLPF